MWHYLSDLLISMAKKSADDRVKQGLSSISLPHLKFFHCLFFFFCSFLVDMRSVAHTL